MLLPALAACGDSGSSTSIEPIGKAKSELDTIGLATRPASLVVLNDRTDVAGRLRFERVLARVGGSVLATLPPRLVVAQLPEHADALLAHLGVVARFDRAVAAGEIPGETLDESRFTAVYSNRWHPAQVAGAARITPHSAPRKANEPFEGAPLVAPRPAGLGAGDPEDSVSTPYASGTVVVSVVLPESNGTIDPSTEDWTEDSLREAYLKVQAALDQIAAAEPNSKLRFVLHFESAPAERGLTGTVDTAYEYGQRAEFNDLANEALATADVLSKILGHPVTPDEMSTAAYEYQLSLRRRYNADAAFFVIVAANQNSTASLRAHARLNGPWATLDSSHATSVFMHEFGHIFGAQDEYCPDACISPLAAPGYLGMYNANAIYREGDSGGINNGKGESTPSLMEGNVMEAVNGYTRGAWGWLDRDGDGIIEVRDTFPKSQLEASVTGQTVRLTGQIVDVPESPMPAFVAYSVNHLTSLTVEIERGGAVLDALDVALPGDTRGRQTVDIPLPPLPQGDYVLRVRAKNEVGNVEPRPFVMHATVGATGNTPPIPHLTLPDKKAVSSARSWSIKASAVDLDGDVPEVRIDLGADGTFDTPWEAARSIDVTPPPGVYPIVVEARDPSGATASTRGELLVLDGNAPPTLHLDPVPSLVHGTPRATLDLTAAATDPEGGAVEYSWLADLATNDGVFHHASGWGPNNRFSIELPTPDRLVSRRLGLGAPEDPAYALDDLLPIGPSTLAVAAGWNGVWFIDVSDPGAPTMLSRLQLETAARKLWRDQNRLYVLGSKLTIVDISDLGRPTEIRQLAPVDDVAAAATSEDVLIGEDVGATHHHDVNGDRIRSTEIKVKTDHAQPADLRVVLHPPRVTGLGPITLRDKEAGPAGVNTWTFNDANTPALAALHGLPATDTWKIEVVDDVSNRIVGTLLNSRIDFGTRSFGAPVLPEANEIVGKLWTGDLVLAGRGVQVLSVSQPTCIQERSRLGGLLSVGATLEGSTVVLATTLQNKGLDETVIGPVKGIVAVDLSLPSMPRVVRKVTPDGEPLTFRRVGTRAYVRLDATCERGAAGCEGPKSSTVVIKTSRFANGSATWKLGESQLLVDHRAFGNDQALWTVGSEGYVQSYDVTDPANLRVSLAYPQNRAEGLVPVGPLADGSDLLLLDGTIVATVADRDRTTNVLSRVYHLTVEARDAAGAVTREYRTVHINPYNHAPAGSRVEHVSIPMGGPDLFKVSGADPDGREIWNPEVFFRVDWDGDGVFDTTWTQMWIDSKEPAQISKRFDQPGTHQLMFEIRDGYYASERIPYTVVVP